MFRHGSTRNEKEIPLELRKSGEVATPRRASIFRRHPCDERFVPNGNTYDASPTASGTFPTALNLGGTVAGDYIDPSTGFHGFIRTPAGAIVSFNPPTDSPASGTTIVFGLNNPGAVVGIYNQATTFVQTGFLRDGSGNFSDIAPNGATLTEANSINDAGTIAGSWVDSAKPTNTHGFVRSASGVYTTFDVTGASSLTVAGINNSGVVAGTYFDAALHSHGYSRSAAGTITTFDAPSPNVDLQVFGIDDSGTITGWAGNGLATGTVFHGFVRQGTTITLFDADPTRVQTFPQSINASGTIVGWDSISQNDANGFVRNGVGTVTSLEVAGASNTQPNSVNSLGTISGILVGCRLQKAWLHRDVRDCRTPAFGVRMQRHI